MKWIYLITISALITGCQSSTGDANANEEEHSASVAATNDNDEANMNEITEEIESLTNVGRQISFQRQIIKSDLDLRKVQTDALQNLGYNSAEYKQATIAVEEMDRDNLKRTLGFVEKYGVAENQSVGRMQSEAMWLVMSHSSNIEIYQRMLPAFEVAWERAYLDPAAFASFLQDYYQLKNGNRLELKNPYRSADEIKALLKELK